MAMCEKIRGFLVDDVSGAASAEFTTLTGLLVAAAVSTLGTFATGVHVVAYAIEADVSIALIDDTSQTGNAGNSKDDGNSKHGAYDGGVGYGRDGLTPN